MKKLIFLVLFLFSKIYAENGVSTYTIYGTSFSYASLETTRANDEINTKNIMTTYHNSKLPTDKFSIFNNFPDAENDKVLYSNTLGTHYLYSPEDFHYTNTIGNTLESIGGGKPLGNRIPIILVHGWQGNRGTTNPRSQIIHTDSPEIYWKNMITFFHEHHNLKSKYKIYLYKYPSYKHVSFNGQILKSMLSNENIIPELKNKEIVFIAHSMGTIVTRSAFEEHKLPIEKIKKICFLAGIHHGSPGSIPNLVALNTSGIVGKDLYTLGSNDMHWDNYDGMIDSSKNIGNSSKSIMLSNIETILQLDVSDYDLEVDMSINEFELLKNYGKYRMTDTYIFDIFFRKKLSNIQKNAGYLLKQNNTTKYILSLIPNPWLTYLNESYVEMSSNYKKKLIFYGGINSNGTLSKNNNLDDTTGMGIAEDGVSHLGELIDIKNAYGYLNDGPVPITSALLDLKYSFDELVDKYQTSQVRIYNDWIESDNSTVKYYTPKDSAYIGDGYSKHILFMDYHHDRMKSGGYSESPSSLDSKRGRAKTGFSSIENRKRYIQESFFNMSYIPDSELFYKIEKNQLIPKTRFLNTINYEPLFLSLAYEIDSLWFKKNFIQPNIEILKYNIVDIPKGEDIWYANMVLDLLKLKEGIINGYGGTKNFKPNNLVNMVEALKMIYFAVSAKTHSTVKIEESKYKIPYLSPNNGYISGDKTKGRQWFFNALYFASIRPEIINENVTNNQGREHYISFWEINDFSSSKFLTRGEIAHMIANALKLEIKNTSYYQNKFPDLSTTHKHYRWIMACAESKIIDGYGDSSFKADEQVNRAEMSKFVYYLYEKLDKDIYGRGK